MSAEVFDPDLDIPVPPVSSGAQVHRGQVLRGPTHLRGPAHHSRFTKLEFRPAPA